TVRIDLRKLESLSGPEAEMLNRYLTMIQVQRQDFNGRMLTIRRDDLRAIACILGVSVDGAGGRLDDMGLSLAH
ncbi:MAG: transcriptional regulator, partial [Acidimicrobiales bacterium]